MGHAKPSVRARGRGAQVSPGGETNRGDIVRSMGWIALAAAWAFVTVAMLSYHAGDPPSLVTWPANDPVANWCGPVGAYLSAWVFKLLGLGAWAGLACCAALLVITIKGRALGHLPLRLIGVCLVVAVVSAIQGLLFPTSGSIPDLPGGLIGAVASAEMGARFGVLGSLLWLLPAGLIGLIVAFDRWMLALPALMVGRVMPAARTAAARAGGASAGGAVGGARAASKAAGGLLTGLRGMFRGRAPVAVRVDDLEGESIPERAVTARKPKPVEVIDEDAGGLGAHESFEEEDSVADEEDEEAEVEDEAAGEPEAPGAPQVYTEQELREKISRLPVRFADANRRMATDDDLRDVQNVTELKGYRFPGLDLLEEPEANFSSRLEGIVREQAEALESSLRQYRIKGEVVGIESGPVITLYHVRLAPGTKVAALNAVSSDIARTLKAVNVRIVANQAGRDTVGVEVPNPAKEKVRLKELMSNRESFASMRLPMFLGKDASGEPLIADLTKMPHMLIAGTTGSGKSVCMNSIIMSFLYTKKPNELKLVLVDPKMVEMTQFKDIPHLMCPVVTEMAKANAILEWACKKMDERYELLAEAGVRDIAGYNALEWEELRERFDPASEAEEARIPRKLPYMVFVIDELADMMMTNKDVEGSIIRIAQKARAVGIHLILATQRPQANVVTGLIKSNMPCRIAFKVASGMDSRIVLDQKGGELLLGQGDMLYLSPQSHKLLRAQGTLVDDKEIRRVVKFMRDIAAPTFERQLIQLRSGDPDEQRLLETENHSSASLAAAQEDPLFDRAVEIVLETKRGSVSLLQRRLAIGYTRASRLIDLMGIAGIISDHKGSQARDVMITPEQWVQMKSLAEASGEQDEDGQQMLFAGGVATIAAEEASRHHAGAESALELSPDQRLEVGETPPFDVEAAAEDENEEAAEEEDGDEEEWDEDESESEDEDWDEDDDGEESEDDEEWDEEEAEADEDDEEGDDSDEDGEGGEDDGDDEEESDDEEWEEDEDEDDDEELDEEDAAEGEDEDGEWEYEYVEEEVEEGADDGVDQTLPERAAG